REQQIPYMDSVVVVQFDGPHGPAHLSVGLDPYRSHGVPAFWAEGTGVGSGSFELYFPITTGRRLRGSHTTHPNGDPNHQIDCFPDLGYDELLEQVDDTLNVIVTEDIEDTFPVPPDYPSPYRALMAGRSQLFGPSTSTNGWVDYKNFYDELNLW